jgi:hypothetical protein
VFYLTMCLLTLQLFNNSIDTQEKLRLNLHSLSVSGLLQYGRKSFSFRKCLKFYRFNISKFLLLYLLSFISAVFRLCTMKHLRML